VEGHVWITPTDIDRLIMSDSERYLSEQGWSKARTIPENSVLITSIASIGKNAINTVPVAFNQQINAIVPQENDAYFILSAMIKDTARFASLAGQTATAIINKTTFAKFQIVVPSIGEQKQVGDFFKNIDQLITIHQRRFLIAKYKGKICQKIKIHNMNFFMNIIVVG
jgi:type I restriction enzyme S subunit